MINRDSMLLWVGFVGAVLGYLVLVGTTPQTWSYQEWLKLGSVLFAWLSGKLATSPLNGENDK